MTATFTTSPFASVLDQVRAGERHPIEALAYLEPDENNIKQIAPHVFAAADEARRRLKGPGKVTAEITFKPDIRAFELVPENDTALHLLRALGPTAKITIHL